MKITFEDYKKAILEKFEIEKNKEKSHYLLDPTPGNLKKLASELSTSISVSDQSVFDVFFNFKEEAIKSKAILNSETDKLRPLSKFLNKKSNLQDVASANLLAVLVDLNDRPFVKFKALKTNETEFKSVDLAENNDRVFVKPTEFVSSKRSFKSFFYVGFFLILILSGFAINKSFQKKCMIWKDDHYEKVDCENTSKRFANYSVLLPFDATLLEGFKKIKISDTTQFFKNDKPIVWYLKQNNKCEFFNSPGLHPTSGKTLKEVTPYIIRTHVYKKR